MPYGINDKAPAGMLAPVAGGFFTPSDPQSGMTNSLPGFTGIPRIPGESLEQYRARLQQAQLPYQQALGEKQQIDKLAGTEEAKSRAILGEQGDLQKTRYRDAAGHSP